MFFPWQKTVWQRLTESVKRDKIAHALLFAGACGIGKLALAKNFAYFLLCQNKDEALQNGQSNCGHCASCNLLLEESHPDLFLVTPEEKSLVIKIDEIRNLADSLSQTAKLGGYKVAILHPADVINKAASNALLKTLEEPDGKTVIMLVTANPGTLLPTIRSRCQQLTLTTPDAAVAEPWLKEQIGKASYTDETLRQVLKLSDHAPLQALKLLEQNDLELRVKLLEHLVIISQGGGDTHTLGADWLGINIIEVVNYLITIVADISKIKNSVPDEFLLYAGQRELLIKLANNINADKLFAYYAKLLQIHKTLQAGICLNQELLLDDLFLEWLEVWSDHEGGGTSRRRKLRLKDCQ